jgi:glycosyltransferase involved in cell wall biosynthesis
MPLFQLLVVPRSLRLARHLSADAVLGLSYYSTMATRMCARRLGIPSVAKLFGVMDLVHTEWPALKYWFKNFEQIAGMSFPQDAWIILNDGTRGDEVARSRGIPEDRIHFLPNGVNLEWQERQFDRGAARKSYGLPDDADVVLFLARLVESKRPQEVVYAAEKIVSRVPRETTFLFAGDGEERARCEALARELGIADHVRFLGVVPHDDIPQIMAASDLFVSTSRLTNMALPTCEALICGVPVVAYDVGDTASLVRAGETGALVPDGDTGALADAIAGMLADREELARMSQAAAGRASESLTGWDDRVAMELEIFEGLIEGKRKGGGDHSTASS